MKTYVKLPNIVPLFEEPYLTVEERVETARRELAKLALVPKRIMPKRIDFVSDESRNNVTLSQRFFAWITR